MALDTQPLSWLDFNDAAPMVDFYESDFETGRAQPDTTGHDRTSPDAVLTFLSPAECAALTMMGSDYVLKFMLDRGQVGCIFGAPGAGKSLIAPYIGYRVALGLRAFGFRTRPEGALVFYCAAEDEIGMRRRIAALRIKHGDTDKLVLIGGVTDLADEKGARRQALMQAIAERKPRLVIVDTLASSFCGLDENSGGEMAWVVFTAKQMIAAGAGSVLFVHHDPKSGAHTPRGHGVFNGELDVTLRVDKGTDGIVRGKLLKNRTGPCERDIAFTIDTIEFGPDADDDPITAPYAHELHPDCLQKQQEPLSRSEKAALDHLQRLITDNIVGTPEKAWRDTCIDGREMSGSDNRENRGKTMTRVVRTLTAKGRIVIRDNTVFWPAPEPEDWEAASS